MAPTCTCRPMRSNTNGEYGTVHPSREAREQVQWVRSMSPKANEMVQWTISSDERPERKRRAVRPRLPRPLRGLEEGQAFLCSLARQEKLSQLERAARQRPQLVFG